MSEAGSAAEVAPRLVNPQLLLLADLEEQSAHTFAHRVAVYESRSPSRQSWAHASTSGTYPWTFARAMSRTSSTSTARSGTASSPFSTTAPHLPLCSFRAEPERWTSFLTRSAGRDIDLKTPSRPPAFCFVTFEQMRDAEEACRGRGCSRAFFTLPCALCFSISLIPPSAAETWLSQAEER